MCIWTWNWFSRILGDIDYPLTPAARAAYRTDTGKRVPPHHWDVYDLVRRIPAGKVSTYKDVCAALGTGSARSVGGALRNNPFAPFVPCHRVVAADMGVGGFRGEWKGVSKEKSQSVPAAEKIQVERNWHEKYKGTGLGNVQKEKVKMLVLEGVAFDERMRVKGGEDVVWRAAMFEPDSA
ncbi:DNA binding methylated-DNA--cysteine S-methyltransferase [Dentipellis sp. KUC8613]|nr:DNA binding methylated-DNA--cysteine S-methyltransferase [Dentipellis sp. KUC8613]